MHHHSVSAYVLVSQDESRRLFKVRGMMGAGADAREVDASLADDEASLHAQVRVDLGPSEDVGVQWITSGVVIQVTPPPTTQPELEAAPVDYVFNLVQERLRYGRSL
jgi:hypothetical protein